MFTDERRSEVCERIQQQGIRTFHERLTPQVFLEAAKRAGVKIAKSPLNLGVLVWLGISAACNVSLDFATILVQTLRVLEDQPDFRTSAVGRARRKVGQRRKPKS